MKQSLDMQQIIFGGFVHYSGWCTGWHKRDEIEGSNFRNHRDSCHLGSRPKTRKALFKNNTHK